jgi:hypothetical protein
MPPGVQSNLGSVAQRVAGANPAANAEFTVSVPSGKSWLLLSVTVSLAQAGAGSSQPLLVIDDGTNTLIESFGSSAAQAVSTTCQYTWAPGLVLTGQVGATTSVHSQGSLPEGFIVPTGGRIRSSTIGLSANTDYGIPSFWIVEYG